MKMIEATRTGAAMFLAVIALCATAQQRQEAERMPVYLIASCNNNPTGEVVESSLRESIRSSSGYVLAEKPEPPPPPGNNNDARVWKPRRDSREEVIATLREVMHLGPNDPAPVPPPLPEGQKKAEETKDPDTQ